MSGRWHQFHAHRTAAPRGKRAGAQTAQTAPAPNAQAASSATHDSVPLLVASLELAPLSSFGGARAPKRLEAVPTRRASRGKLASFDAHLLATTPPSRFLALPVGLTRNRSPSDLPLPPTTHPPRRVLPRCSSPLTFPPSANVCMLLQQTNPQARRTLMALWPPRRSEHTAGRQLKRRKAARTQARTRRVLPARRRPVRNSLCAVTAV